MKWRSQFAPTKCETPCYLAEIASQNNAKPIVNTQAQNVLTK